jgi:cysteine desulfurase / selenocysteine lyase
VGPLRSRHDYAALAESVYFNQASLGLIPAETIEVMTRHLTETAQHGNLHFTDDQELHILDDLRRVGATLLGAPPECVAVLGGASEGLAIAAGLIHGGDVVLVPSDFPSVTYPWLVATTPGKPDRTVTWVDDRADRDLTDALVEAIRPGVAAVCVSAVMYATGSQIDCVRLASRAHEVGARLIVDATQLAGAGVVDMATWDADVVVASGYKWLSSHGGVALMAVAHDLFEAMPPHPGWMGADQPFAFDALRLRLARGARRFEQSTLAYSSALGLAQSVTRLNAIGYDAIEAHARVLAEELVDAVESLGWRPFRSLGDPSASAHIVALRHPGLDASMVRQVLHHEHRIVTSARLGAIRISLHVYNDSSDIEMLAGALGMVGRGAISGPERR